MTVYNNSFVRFYPIVQDPDGDIRRALFEWDFDGDGKFEENTSDTYFVHDYNITYIFDKLQVITITLKVTDKYGASAEDNCLVKVIENNINFELMSDKYFYSSNEPILITASLYNNGSQPINFSEMNLHFTTINITVETPEEYILYQKIRIMTIPIPIFTEPYGFYNYTFDLTDPGWDFATPDGSVTDYKFNTPGQYTVNINFNSYQGTIEYPGSSNVWNGETSTKVLYFSVV